MNNELRQALRPVKARLRFVRFWRMGGWGLLAGASLGLILLIISLFLPMPEKWLIVLFCVPAGGSALGLGGLFWPVRDERAAKAADACGLRERAQTALTLLNRNDPMALLQREDACRALGELNTENIPLPTSIRPMAVFAGLLLLIGVFALLPDPQADALARMKDFSIKMAEAEKLAEAEEKTLEERLSEAEAQELRRLLADLQRQLKSVRNQRDAYLALDEAEKRLENIRSSLPRQSGAEVLSQAGLSALAKALESGDQNALQQAAEEMMENGEEAAQSLSQAAEQMDGASAQAMQAAASALSAGDMNGLMSALNSLSQQELTAALSQLQSMLAQLRAMASDSNMAGLSGMKQGQGGGSNQASGQGEGQGGAGRGSTHEDAGYKEDTGRQRGQGKSDPEYRENAYETIYDPTRLNAEQTNIQESGALNQGENLQISAGPGLGTGGQVPYRQVAAEYQEAAAQAMSRMALPAQEQQWVNDYFAALTDE